MIRSRSSGNLENLSLVFVVLQHAHPNNLERLSAGRAFFIRRAYEGEK